MHTFLELDREPCFATNPLGTTVEARHLKRLEASLSESWLLACRPVGGAGANERRPF